MAKEKKQRIRIGTGGGPTEAQVKAAKKPKKKPKKPADDKPADDKPADGN